MSRIDRDVLVTAPKVLLHDHLDGGLRPSTVIELAQEYGYKNLPTHDVDELALWFNRGAKRNDLVLYLETFAHTVGVMQHRDAIERVAFECAQDLAADGVVYAEVRMAPELSTEAGLTLDEATEAMLDGFARGAAGTDLVINLICSAMRTAARSLEIAELAVRWRDRGVVGFDIAGAEAGYPPTRHLDAFQYVQRENFHTTIHAGEAFGLPSIWEAVQFCGAERLGHGVRIVDDITGPEAAPRVTSSSAAWPRSCATDASHSSSAPPRTSAPACAHPSPSTPSACSDGCASASHSTPTTDS
jgi:adenosine deaminase